MFVEVLCMVLALLVSMKYVPKYLFLRYKDAHEIPNKSLADTNEFTSARIWVSESGVYFQMRSHLRLFSPKWENL